VAGGRAFADRDDAGRALAGPVAGVLPPDRPVVAVGLVRGGAVVGAALVTALRARGLPARLAVLPVAKVRSPGQAELAVGAVTASATVRSDVGCRLAAVDPAGFTSLAARAREELAARRALWPDPGDLEGAAVLVVDDGLATGATALAALAELRARRPAWLGLAVPVADASALARVRPDADAVVAPVVRHPLRAVSLDYADFRAASEAEVRAALAAAG
jgi:putative phosphoribosyl transferase